MSPPVLIVISGPPCSGKSRLASKLGERLGWPVVGKDEFKELLFDTLGAGDADWSRRLSLAAFEIQFGVASRLLDAGLCVLLEGNFRPVDHASRVAALAEGRADLVQIACRAHPAELARRLSERAAAGLRHPGHLDGSRESAPDRYGPLPIETTLVYETGGAVDAGFPALLERLAAAGPARRYFRPG